MKTYRLQELNEFIRRTIALNLPEAVWVSCEIVQLNRTRGHFYLSIVENDETGEQVIARADAIMWSWQYQRIRRQRGRTIEQSLQEGMEVLLKLQVDFHERYGFRVLIEDIQPEYTLGQLALARQQLLEQLTAENLLDKNKTLPMPAVVKRIAVLSSGQAAGYQDFREHLRGNEFGYTFQLQFYPTSVQGDQMPAEMMRQLKQIEMRADQYDAVAIIRGGGARLDLLAFDHPDLCRRIAHCPLPVLTGIGHETDESVVDLVAHRSLKTPTALADYLIHRCWQYESDMESLFQVSIELFRDRIRNEKEELGFLKEHITLPIRQRIGRNSETLSMIAQTIPALVRSRVQADQRQLNVLQQLFELIEPEAVLRRGFVLVQQDGVWVRRAQDLDPSAALEIRWADGQKKLNTKREK